MGGWKGAFVNWGVGEKRVKEKGTVLIKGERTVIVKDCGSVVVIVSKRRRKKKKSVNWHGGK